MRCMVIFLLSASNSIVTLAALFSNSSSTNVSSPLSTSELESSGPNTTSSVTTTETHDVGYYINAGIDSGSLSETAVSSGTVTSTSSGVLTVSKIVVRTSTLLASQQTGQTNASLGTAVASQSSYASLSPTPIGSIVTASRSSQFPQSWLSKCPQLSLAVYTPPAISGVVNSSEYISSCDAAQRAYALSLYSFNATVRESSLTMNPWNYTDTDHPTVLTPSTPAAGVYTLCDKYPRLNTSDWDYYITTTTVKTYSGIHTTTLYQYPESCVFNGTSPAFPKKRPDCTIPPPVCADLWSSWAATGDPNEFTTYPTPFAGPPTTPECNTGAIPGFKCSLIVDGISTSHVECNTDAARCTVNANNVQIYFWPPTTTNGGLCATDATTITPPGARYATISLAPNNTVTITSPTVYVSLDRVFASGGINSPAAGYSKYYNVTFAMNPATMSSVEVFAKGLENSWQAELQNIFSSSLPIYLGLAPKSFNFADLQNPVPASVYFLGAGTQGWAARYFQTYFGLRQDVTRPIDSTIYLDYSAVLSIPPELISLDPAWASCRPDLDGAYDPPITLTPAGSIAAATPPNTHQTTTPATPSQTPSAVPAATMTSDPVDPTTVASAKVPGPSTSDTTSPSPNPPSDPSSSSASTGVSADPIQDHTSLSSSSSASRSALPSNDPSPTGSPTSTLTTGVADPTSDPSHALSSSSMSGSTASAGDPPVDPPTPSASTPSDQDPTSSDDAGGLLSAVFSAASQAKQSSNVASGGASSPVDPAATKTSDFSGAAEQVATLTGGSSQLVVTQKVVTNSAGSTITENIVGSQTINAGQVVTLDSVTASAVSGHLVVDGSTISFAAPARGPSVLGTLTLASSAMAISQIVTTNGAGSTLTEELVGGLTLTDGQKITIGADAISVAGGRLVLDGSTVSFDKASPVSNVEAIATVNGGSSNLIVSQVITTDGAGHTSTEEIIGAYTLAQGQVATIGTKIFSAVAGGLVVDGSTVSFSTLSHSAVEAIATVFVQSSPLVVTHLVTTNSAGLPITEDIINGVTLKEGQTATVAGETFSLVSGSLRQGTSTIQFAATSTVASPAGTSSALISSAGTRTGSVTTTKASSLSSGAASVALLSCAWAIVLGSMAVVAPILLQTI